MSAHTHTFLFTDIEGSYRQWERHPEAMPRALAAHDAIVQEAVSGSGGRIFKTVGDAVCAVFERPADGVRAAVHAQRALHDADWNEIGLAQPLTVRMALQAGEAEERDGDYAGLVLNRISRLLRAGHGGQVLISPYVAADLQRVTLPGVGVRDLGERRLRDVPGANHIYQLEIDGLPATFPPLETLDAIAHNLPVALNACLDRESEQARIRRLLLDSPARLVTLLGPGGIGKTRLALHAAGQLIDSFSGGVWFIDLSGVRDAGLVPATIASVLGVRLEPGADPVATIAAQVGDRQLLLILDNCEQIIDGVAHFVAALLPQATGLRVLATSRVPLQIRGEQRVEIGPLPVELDQLAGPAVQLFLERAQQMRPAFELTDANRESIFEICHRVDGIPLALELAAARVAVLSPEALRNRLSSRLSLLTSSSRDLPERHQTLRAAIAWSYALLTEEEQRAFRQLSVFQGGWSFAGAQAVLGLDELATVEVLVSLRDKSLVRLSETDDAEPRYSMLETIQEYGFEQLTGHDELDAARSVHAEFYVGLTEQSERPIQGGPEQRFWLDTIDREIANARIALQWSLDSGAIEQALQLCMNLWFYWSSRGLGEEGQHWFEQIIEMTGEVDPLLQAAALRRMGNLSVERGDIAAAEMLYCKSLEIVRAGDDVLGLAQSLSSLGMVLGMQGHSDEEYAYQSEALALCRGMGALRGTVACLVNLAVWARNVGQPAEALRLHDEAFALQLEQRDEIGVAFSQIYMAQIRIDLGELDVASALLEQAEQQLVGMQNSDGLLWIGLKRAALELKRSNPARVSILIEEAIEGYRRRGDLRMLAEALETKAAAAVVLGNYSDGAEALGAARHLRVRTAAAISPVDAPILERTDQALRLALGDNLFAMHWELGRQREIRAGWDRFLMLQPQTTGI